MIAVTVAHVLAVTAAWLLALREWASADAGRPIDTAAFSGRDLDRISL